MYSLWVEDVFWLPQLRRGLNPNSVEGLVPSLSAVGTTHNRDLCPKGVLSLGYPDIIVILLSLILSLLGLHFCLIGLVPRLLSLAFQLLGLFQLLPKGRYLLFRGSQLLFSIT